MATMLQPWCADVPASGLYQTGNSPILAGDRAKVLALLVGCALGLGLSWHGVLPEGARDRLAAAVTGSNAGRNVVLGAESPQPDHDVPSIPGMMPSAARQPENELALWPTDALAFPVEERRPLPGPFAAAMAARLSMPESWAAVRSEPSEAEVPAQAMEVTFPLNSSYLPAGAADRLGRFLERLPKSGGVALEMLAAVSDDGVKDADSTAAQRYNRWLAERRLARVEEFLERRGNGRITVSAGLLEHDSSRRVLLSERPGP